MPSLAVACTDPTKYLFISLEQKRKDQAKPYDGKKMCWIPDEKECYVFGMIQEFKGDVNVVEVAPGDTVSPAACLYPTPAPSCPRPRFTPC